MSSPAISLVPFTILLHCSIQNESSPNFQPLATIGVLSTDSLLTIKKSVLKKIITPFKSYTFQLCSGEYLLNDHSTEEDLSSLVIGDFVASSSVIQSTAHLTVLVVNREEVHTQITTPTLRAKEERDCMHIKNSDSTYRSDEDQGVAPELDHTIENNNNHTQNGDTDILKVVYKILVFFLLVRSDAVLLNILSLMFISFLLVMNYFKLLDFCVKPRSQNDIAILPSEQSTSDRIFCAFEDIKYNLLSFFVSAFPTCVIIKSTPIQ